MITPNGPDPHGSIPGEAAEAGRAAAPVNIACFTLLSLGDSYTVGEGVPIYGSFPYQAVQLLRAAGHAFSAPEIVARTGWTSAELLEGLGDTKLLPSYDFVTLLIGVNNEYRGRSLSEYELEFGRLLRLAIGLGRQDPLRVFVLSIPDWSVTPFAGSHLPDAAGRDREAVAGEIDAFNAAGARIAGEQGVAFIDITGHTRGHGREPEEWLAADLLHPSGREYRYWAEQVCAGVRERIGQGLGSMGQ